MIIRNIVLEGFRNYQCVRADFGEEVNILVGDNAQGKTNLLEAVYYLTLGRSFRTRLDREVIGFDKDCASIRADIFSGGRDQKLEIRLYRGAKKQIFAGGVRLKNASALSGRLTAVLFCPDDLNIIREGSAARRRLMDMCLIQLRPRYAAALSEFGRVYEQKTRILRDWREKPSLLEALDDYDCRMAQLSAELISYRARFSRKLAQAGKKIHADFSGGAEELDIEYKTVGAIKDPLRPASELVPELMDHLCSHRRAELDSGLCLSGAHKDDLEISINGKPARSFASQGQTRTAALSLKLAEREIHYGDRGEYPLLLLDDVLSELDPVRQSFVLNRIGGGQVFITCCEDSQVSEKTGGKILRVSRGEIS